MKARLIIFLIGIVSCGFIWLSLSNVRAESYSGKPTPTFMDAQAMAVQNTPQATSTPTVMPSATIGYQETAISAQQTANSAVQANAAITAGYEQRIHEQVQITEANNQREFERDIWTVQAAPTSIPLTSTQQVIDNTKEANEQNFFYAKETSAVNAPTQAAAMINVDQLEKWGWIDYLVKGVVGVFLIVLVVVMIYFIRKDQAREARALMEEKEPKQPHRNMVLDFHDKSGGAGHFQSSLSTLPLDEIDGPRLLDEFAAGILSKEKTLAINDWEGNDSITKWNRDLYLPFRVWMENPFNEPKDDIKRGFVVKDANNRLVPLQALYDFLNVWVNTRKLSDDFEFQPVSAATAEPSSGPAEDEPEGMGEWAPEYQS